MHYSNKKIHLSSVNDDGHGPKLVIPTIKILPPPNLIVSLPKVGKQFYKYYAIWGKTWYLKHVLRYRPYTLLLHKLNIGWRLDIGSHVTVTFREQSTFRNNTLQSTTQRLYVLKLTSLITGLIS